MVQWSSLQMRHLTMPFCMLFSFSSGSSSLLSGSSLLVMNCRRKFSIISEIPFHNHASVCWHLHEDIFRNDGGGWVRARLVPLGRTKLGPGLPLSNCFGHLPLLDLVVPNHLELAVIVINAILGHNLQTILDLLTVLWQAQTLTIKKTIKNMQKICKCHFTKCGITIILAFNVICPAGLDPETNENKQRQSDTL